MYYFWFVCAFRLLFVTCYYLNVIFCVTMLECIRKYIRDRFISKKQERWTHPLGHLTWTIYLENKQKSSSCNAAFNERYLFEVTYNTNGTVFVDLQNRTCTCRAWQLLGMLCRHSMRCIIMHRENQLHMFIYYLRGKHLKCHIDQFFLQLTV